MRRVSIVIAVCFVLALAISLVGQGRDLDAIMKEVGPLWQTPQTGLDAIARQSRRLTTRRSRRMLPSCSHCSRKLKPSFPR